MQITKSPQELDEIADVGALASRLSREGNSFDDVVSTLLVDPSVPARFQNKTTLEDITRATQVIDPLDKNGNTGTWKRLFNVQYNKAVDDKAKELLNAYTKELKRQDEITKATRTASKDINEVIESLKDVPDDQFETALINELSSLSKKEAVNSSLMVLMAEVSTPCTSSQKR